VKRVRPPDPDQVRRLLLRWFARHRRDFFWRREGLRPFQLLLVEFLLWKTSSRSAPLIESIVARHPAPEHVLRRSRQELEDELRPLGLFRRRAGCMLAFSEQILQRGGEVPREPAALQELTGIGQYAARATACVLAGSRLMPVDANTSRVFGRLYGEEGPGPREPGAAWDARFDAFVPRRDPKRFLWAIMDLAATTCVPREPRCPSCPLRSECVTGRRRTGQLG
jgi:A/G-specific adenine glycosylase